MLRCEDIMSLACSDLPTSMHIAFMVVPRATASTAASRTLDTRKTYKASREGSASSVSLHFPRGPLALP